MRSDFVPDLIAKLEQAVAENPWNGRAHQAFGGLLEIIGHSDRALSHLVRATQLEPRHSFGWYELGAALLRRGRHMEARVAFERAVQILPEFVRAIYKLAVCYGIGGDWVAAYVAFDRVAVLYQKRELGAVALQHMREMRSADQRFAGWIRRAIDRSRGRNPPRPLDVRLVKLLQRGFAEESRKALDEAERTFEELRRQLPFETAGYGLVCQYLSDIYVVLNRHIDALTEALRARTVVLCANALITPMVRFAVDPGRFQDTDAFYHELLEKEFGVA